MFQRTGRSEAVPGAPGRLLPLGFDSFPKKKKETRHGCYITVAQKPDMGGILPKNILSFQDTTVSLITQG